MNPKEEAREIRRMATQIYCMMISVPEEEKSWCGDYHKIAYDWSVESHAEFMKLETERYAEREKGEG